MDALLLLPLPLPLPQAISFHLYPAPQSPPAEDARSEAKQPGKISRADVLL